MYLSRTAAASSWIIVAIVCCAIILIGFSIGQKPDGSQSDGTEQKAAPLQLERTAVFARQKQRSLKTYNNEISTEELLEFYLKHTKHHVSEEAFAELNRSMNSDVLQVLWFESSKRSSEVHTIVHRAMVESIQRFFPHQTLTNADVILFPDSSNLRIIVSEPASDFFRDTARHWQWIAEFAENQTQGDVEGLKELDAYAAEELSEFLSVLAVGIVELAAAHSEDNLIDADEVKSVLNQISGYKPDLVMPRNSKLGYSEDARKKIAGQLPGKLFNDITRESGIDFLHKPAPDHQELRTRLAIPFGIAGGGVSVGDINGDSRLDIYFAGDKGGALYSNRGGNTFSDVSELSGLPTEGESRAGYFVDYDNDGDNDLFITFVGARNRLYRNDGKGHLQDISDDVGLLKDEFTSHEAVWFDMDNDGLLELYVANFGDWLSGDSPTIGRINNNAPPNRLYKHGLVDGRHQFTEIGEKLEVDDRGWTHCVGAYDLDQDGWTDLFSINDFGTSFVYKNLMGQSFEEISREVRLDDIYNGMSFTLLDLNHDSNFSIYVSQIMKLTHRQRYSRPTESTAVRFDSSKKDNLRVLVSNRLFSRAFETSFRDDHNYLIEPANLGWSWGVGGLDYENDSDIDLLVLNGTESAIPTNPDAKIDGYVGGRNYLAKFNFERNVFFVQQDGYFYDWSDKNPIAFYGNSRGSAVFDSDDDGDLDVVVSNYNHSPAFFENLQSTKNNWIDFKLEGTTSNRNAIGAVVKIEFGTSKRFATVVSGTGFLSQNPYQVHFGLGRAEEVKRAVIQWPTGEKSELEHLEINRLHIVREDKVD